MGAMAEAIVAYAQPLVDETDGSIEQMNKAMSVRTGNGLMTSGGRPRRSSS